MNGRTFLALAALIAIALVSGCSVYLDESLLGASDGGNAPTTASGDDAGAGAKPSPTHDSGTAASTSLPPALTALSPNHAATGSPDVPIVATGTGFDSRSRIVLAGASLATTFVDDTTLEATIPAASLATPGSLPVTIVTPNPGGGTSSAIAFTVSGASITLTSIDPASAVAGAGDTAIQANGNGFAAGYIVRFNGVDLTTVFGGSAQITATIPASLLTTAGTFPVTVAAPSPSTDTAMPIDFTVANPVPTLASLTPASLTVGAADTTITLTGTGFVNGASIAHSGQAALATTYVSATQLTAVVPHEALALPGKIQITVVNALPGGGASAPIDVPINCDSSGVDIPFTATAQPASRSTNLTVQLRSYKDGATCPAALYSSLNEGSRGWVVQNQTGVTAVLSAWAVCTSSADDAYLTFYRRATVPSTASDLMACTPTISEGKNGTGGYYSPESNASPWCPGLTKSNGQGITIGVCEKVVVFMQEYDVGTGPGTVKAQIDLP